MKGAAHPKLVKPLRRLDQGDLLIVKRLDRPAKSTRDLLNLLDVVAAQARAGVCALKDTWADTMKEWSGS